MKTLFLLLSVKESDLIEIIKGDLPSITPKKEFKLQQQRSRWSKAKDVIKLLQKIH
jgi:hypothetical protein